MSQINNIMYGFIKISLTNSMKLILIQCIVEGQMDGEKEERMNDMWPG
jgi:hypothetical protein